MRFSRDELLPMFRVMRAMKFGADDLVATSLPFRAWSAIQSARGEGGVFPDDGADIEIDEGALDYLVHLVNQAYRVPMLRNAVAVTDRFADGVARREAVLQAEAEAAKALKKSGRPEEKRRPGRAAGSSPTE